MTGITVSVYVKCNDDATDVDEGPNGDETNVKRDGRYVMRDVQYEDAVWIIKIHTVHRQGKKS